MKKNLKKEKNEGITLIALVITIIVLLILAGVVIATLTGDNGILTNANKSKTTNALASVEENLKLKLQEIEMEAQMESTTNPGTSLSNKLTTFLGQSEAKIKSDIGTTEENISITISDIDSNTKSIKIKYNNDSNAAERNYKINLTTGKLEYVDSEDSGNSGETVGKCTVTLNANGGSLPANQSSTISVTKGEAIGSLPTPTYDEWNSFRGWYTTENGGTEVNENTIIGIDMTIYAQWDSFCLIAGTQILTENGYKNIEDIQVGELVYSINIDNNQKELKEVQKTYHHKASETLKIKVGEENIELTPRHEVFVVDKGWIRAYDLTIGDIIQTENSKNAEITEIETMHYEEKIDVYNLSIEGNHNYLITNSNLLVHNVS